MKFVLTNVIALEAFYTFMTVVHSSWNRMLPSLKGSFINFVTQLRGVVDRPLCCDRALVFWHKGVMEGGSENWVT